MRPHFFWKCFLLLSLLASMGCNNKNKGDNRDTVNQDKNKDDKVNVDQRVTQRLIPRDSVFIDFEKNWTKFISRAPELIRPVMQRPTGPAWEPVIVTDCVYSQEVGGVVPQVEITWTEPQVQQERIVRFDIALQSQGFERNYYTTAFPMQAPQRFVIPGVSAFIRDTAAMLLTGPAVLPKVTQFTEMAITGDTSQQVRTFEPAGVSTALLRKTLKIQELGFGLSYKLRMAAFNREVWQPSREIIFTTPICPMDYR